MTHQVTHRNRETKNKVPFRSGYRRRDAALRYPLGLSADIRGVNQKRVLFKKMCSSTRVCFLVEARVNNNLGDGSRAQLGEQRAEVGGTADRGEWDGGPKWVERRTKVSGTADRSGWNGGPKWVERRTSKVGRRTGRS